MTRPFALVSLTSATSGADDDHAFFVGMYKAAAIPGSPEPATLDGVLEAWLKDVPNLDFQKKAPVWPSQTWLNYSTFFVGHIEGSLKEATDRHAEALGLPLLAAIEEFLGDGIFHLLKSGAVISATAVGVQQSTFRLFGDRGAEAERVRRKWFSVCKVSSPPTTRLRTNRSVFRKGLGRKTQRRRGGTVAQMRSSSLRMGQLWGNKTPR